MLILYYLPLVHNALLLHPWSKNKAQKKEKQNLELTNQLSYLWIYWLKDSLCSIDHMKALNIGGKNKLANMGLCRAITNTHKTDIPFDEWCRMYPGTYLHIPNHVEQLKTMQAEGIYKKIGLNAHYTDDVISTIEELSPQEKPIKIKK